MKLTVSAQGFAPEFRTLTVTSNNSPLTVVLQPGHVIRGRVVDADGQPLAGADVWYEGLAGQPQDFDAGLAIGWKAKTDHAGRFGWDSAPAEPVCLTIHKPGYRVLSRVTVKPDADHAFTFTLNK